MAGSNPTQRRSLNPLDFRRYLEGRENLVWIPGICNGFGSFPRASED